MSDELLFVLWCLVFIFSLVDMATVVSSLVSLPNTRIQHHLWTIYGILLSADSDSLGLISVDLVLGV